MSSTSQSSLATKYLHFWATDGEAPCEVIERAVVSLPNPQQNSFDGAFFFEYRNALYRRATKSFPFWALDGEPPCEVIKRENVSLSNPRHNFFDAPFFFDSFLGFCFLISTSFGELYVREGHLSNCLTTSIRHV